MNISQKTIEKLTTLINEETEYRSGPKLVAFFNQYGFRDVYRSGFPSRGKYTEGNICVLNGTPELDRCIKDVFAPINFIGRYSELDKFIASFNQYLRFDGWEVVRQGSEIVLSRARGIDIDKEKEKEQRLNTTETDFLNADFADLAIETLPIDNCVLPYIEARISEIKTCLSVKAALSVIFLSGSTLEGVLLGLAQSNPAMYNRAKSAPKDNKTGKIRPFHEWTLSSLIETSCEIGFLQEDVRKFSHSLRDFRNYIHPFQQMSEHFSPDENTAKICFQVLKAALFQINKQNKV